MNESTLLELEARKAIDQKLISAGWVVQDKNRLNLREALGVTVREMDTETGPADYMLFIDGAACGIIEAKREGAELGHVDIQSRRYATSGIRYVERAAAEGQPPHPNPEPAPLYRVLPAEEGVNQGSHLK